MQRGFLIVLLTLGVVAGYGCGFSHLRQHRHAMFEQHEKHFAEVCADAARRAIENKPAPANNTAPTEP